MGRLPGAKQQARLALGCVSLRHDARLLPLPLRLGNSAWLLGHVARQRPLTPLGHVEGWLGLGLRLLWRVHRLSHTHVALRLLRPCILGCVGQRLTLGCVGRHLTLTLGYVDQRLPLTLGPVGRLLTLGCVDQRLPLTLGPVGRCLTLGCVDRRLPLTLGCVERCMPLTLGREGRCLTPTRVGRPFTLLRVGRPLTLTLGCVVRLPVDQLLLGTASLLRYARLLLPTPVAGELRGLLPRLIA